MNAALILLLIRVRSPKLADDTVERLRGEVQVKLRLLALTTGIARVKKAWSSLRSLVVKLKWWGSTWDETLSA